MEDVGSGWTDTVEVKVTEVEVVKPLEAKHWMAHHFLGPEMLPRGAGRRCGAKTIPVYMAGNHKEARRWQR